ncbi:MAG TPA: DUF885 family protein [Anaeromyxobacteraceae bacterium]|nr:DUF885 family protein [Anaeromyxobacteraceae bacterium]
MRHRLLAVLAVSWCGCATPHPSPPPAGPPESASVGERRRAFEALLAEHWEYVLSRAPEKASILGDKRFNDKLSDLSASAVAADVARTKEFLSRFESVDATGFTEQEALTRTLLVRDFRESLQEAAFEEWKMPVNQMQGIHLFAPRLVALLSFTTVKDYDDYLARLRGLPRQFVDTEANMRLGMAAGLMPPRFLLEKVAVQAAGIASQKPEDTPFARPLSRMPPGIAPAEEERIRAATLAAIRDDVLPAYRRFATFVRDEYAPRGRTEMGIWSLPDGAARYAAKVRQSTTTSLSADQIHEIGLREVARIEAEMLAVAKRAGFSDLSTFRASLQTNAALRPRSREQILEIYRGYLDGMRPELPKLFGRLPKADFVVVAVEPFREKEAAGANYMIPAADGSRPGRIEVNTGDFANRKTITMESTAYHEAIPGHHLQLALQQELEGLPPQRRLLPHYTAFIEGWALYAERLGEEVGRYRDPYSYYGHLQDEMLRAIRLVVDTGLHEKRWTRDQVVQFFHDHSAIDEVEVQAETDRYIAWPSQALGYKVGELEIRELRERSRSELGPAFDVRRFHDVVLGAGSVPLDVLDVRVSAWVASEKSARSPKA